MTKTPQTPAVKSNPLALIGFILSLIMVAYLLPIWSIALYLIGAPASENGVGWIMVGLIFAGMAIIPLLVLASAVLSIISIVKKSPNKVLAFWALGIIAGSLLLSYVLLSST